MNRSHFLTGILGLSLVFGLTLAACATAPVDTAVSSQDVLIQNGARQVPATLTLPAGKGPFPLVVMQHGFAGSRQEGGGFAHLAETLAAHGIAAIRMDFPGCGDSKESFIEYSLSACISDSNACLDWALKNAPVDRKRLGVLGYSNGGRMALLMSIEANFPYKAMGLLAPAYFTETNAPEGFNNPREQLSIAEARGYYEMEWFGRTLQVGARNFIDEIASFETFKNLSKKVDSLIVYGDADTTVPPAINIALKDVLQVNAVEVPGANHAYGFYIEYSDQPGVTAAVEGAFVRFFTQKL
jgi:dienelactone hydrolase